MDTSNDLQALASDLEKALTGLIKLIKALSFYPADHPSLEAAAQEANNDFAPLLKHHHTRPYHVTKAGFNVDGTPLAPTNKNLEKLAQKLVERRVRHLLLLPNLSNFELLVFAEEIAKPAEELLSAGGIEKRLQERRIKAIWVNETDLETVQRETNIDLKQAVEHLAKPPLTDESPEPPPPEQADRIAMMRDLLEQLKEPQDNQTYQEIISQVQSLAYAFFNATGISGLLAVFNLLESHRKDSTRDYAQRLAAETLTDYLLTEANCKTLVDGIGDKQLKASQHRALVRLTVSLGVKIAPQLLKRLYAERDAIIRRHYTEILAHMGEDIFDLLKVDLQNTTWHVVRNAVTVLGKTRLEAALPLLSKVIQHPEVRVRRAVIRALSAIGSGSCIPLLVRLTQDKNAELHQPAIMALGALKNPKAIPPLVSLLKRIDPLGKRTELKTEVIHALAATKSPKAIIPLLKQAKRLNPLQSKTIETLRAEAILAIGQVGNSQLIPVLERLPRQEKDPVSRALKHATSQLRKQHAG